MQSNIIQYRKRGSVLPKTKHGPQPFAVEGRFSFICYLSSVRGLETLVFRFDEAVFPVFPFVNDADGIGLGIEEYEEVVADEVHLQDSFFDVHGTSGKFLDTSDFKGSSGTAGPSMRAALKVPFFMRRAILVLYL